jgi:hypothetical protein
VSRFAKVDRNHVQIVEAFRQHPQVSVFSTARLGGGVPDLILGVDGWTIPVEVKVGKKKLNRLQQAWHEAWHGTPVVIVRTVEEANVLVQNVRMAQRVFSHPLLRVEEQTT